MNFLLLLWISFSNLNGQISEYQKQKVVATDRQQSASFGWTIDLDDNFLVVGVPGQLILNQEEKISSAGKVFVYQKKTSANNWDPMQEIELNSPNKLDLFGGAVSINGDFLFVGADGKERKHLPSYYREGLVKVYQLKNGEWVEVQELNSPNGNKNSGFGSSVESSGKYCIVSCMNGEKAYLYSLENNTWDLVDSVKANNSFTGGFPLSIHENIVVIGSAKQTVNSKKGEFKNCGEVNVYRITDHNKLDKVGTILPPSPSVGQKFGSRVKINNNRIVVSCNVSENRFGRPVFVYNLIDGNLIYEATLKCPDNLKGNWFGLEIDISDEKIIIGAMGVDKNSKGELIPYEGSAYLFCKNEQWIFQEKLKAINKAEWDKFGFSVAIHKNTIAVGNRFDKEDKKEENYLKDAGSVVIFTKKKK